LQKTAKKPYKGVYIVGGIVISVVVILIVIVIVAVLLLIKNNKVQSGSSASSISSSLLQAALDRLNEKDGKPQLQKSTEENKQKTVVEAAEDLEPQPNVTFKPMDYEDQGAYPQQDEEDYEEDVKQFRAIGDGDGFAAF
jgi:uncharacterized membrane protein